MKNNKGITLTSLVIYIAVIFVVIAVLMRVTTYFSNNMQDAADVFFETEFQKINIYLLEDSKKTDNEILEITEEGKQITFKKGNKYTFNAEEKIIYLNDKIKVCEGVENCLFEEKTADNGKSILSLTIKIKGVEKTVNYVIKEITVIVGSEKQDYINEEDYIFNMHSNPPTKTLPAEYQKVEYIESTGEQYIDTGVNGGEKMSFDIKLNTLGSVFQTFEQYFAGDKSTKGVKLYADVYSLLQSGNVVIQCESYNVSAYSIKDTSIHTIQLTDGGTILVDGVVVNQSTPNNRLGNTFLLYF